MLVGDCIQIVTVDNVRDGALSVLSLVICLLVNKLSSSYWFHWCQMFQRSKIMNCSRASNLSHSSKRNHPSLPLDWNSADAGILYIPFRDTGSVTSNQSSPYIIAEFQ